MSTFDSSGVFCNKKEVYQKINELIFFKPEFTTLEVCHRLELNEAQKENKYGKEMRK